MKHTRLLIVAQKIITVNMVYVCVCACVHVCRPEVEVICLLYWLFTLFTEPGSFAEPGAC